MIAAKNASCRKGKHTRRQDAFFLENGTVVDLRNGRMAAMFVATRNSHVGIAKLLIRNSALRSTDANKQIMPNTSHNHVPEV
jgi:hypothetical protein